MKNIVHITLVLFILSASSNSRSRETENRPTASQSTPKDITHMIEHTEKTEYKFQCINDTNDACKVFLILMHQNFAGHDFTSENQAIKNTTWALLKSFHSDDSRPYKHLKEEMDQAGINIKDIKINVTLHQNYLNRLLGYYASQGTINISSTKTYENKELPNNNPNYYLTPPTIPGTITKGTQWNRTTVSHTNIFQENSSTE